MYILAKDEGSVSEGSILANLNSSVMAVFKIVNNLVTGSFDEFLTLERTDNRNSDVWDLIKGLADVDDDGIKWGNVSLKYD